MTALATGLALVPLAWAGNKPGHEIEHPMAVVILGGLVTSTLLNLGLMPALYLAFGRAGGRPEDEEEGLTSASHEERWALHKTQPVLTTAATSASAGD
jgi:AcrB/AcrD/AcrF family